MSNKVTCVVSCPLDTYSGYGKRSFDFVKELIKVKPGWEISILSQRWGNCRFGYLEDHGEYELMSHIVERLTFKPDIWIQITVPNEFQPIGQYNIGITAAMETTVCDSSWVLGCNRMDLVLTSSKHGKFSLENSKYVNDKTQESLEITTPIEVLFEGVDPKYHRISSSFKSKILDGVTNSWNYLVVGHWMQGDFGQDRKNIGYTIKMFLETFKDTEKAPGLVLKVMRATTSVTDRDEILNRIYSIRESVTYAKSLPDIYLLHGDLTDEEMNELYNDYRIKAMVSFTKGEGYGRPLIEFAAVGKPILCSGWSGQLDFLSKEFTAFVGGTVERVHPSAVVPNMILPEASWFKPDDNIASLGYQEIFRKYSDWKAKAREQEKRVCKEFSVEAMGKRILEILNKHMPNIPQEVALVLPE